MSQFKDETFLGARTLDLFHGKSALLKSSGEIQIRRHDSLLFRCPMKQLSLLLQTLSPFTKATFMCPDFFLVYTFFIIIISAAYSDRMGMTMRMPLFRPCIEKSSALLMSEGVGMFISEV